jgi:hypothetical protein
LSNPEQPRDPGEQAGATAGAGGEGGAPAERLTVSQIFIGLFFFPHVVLLLLQEQRCRRALGLVLCSCLVCGMLLGVARIPKFLGLSTDWARWLSSEVSVLWVEDGALRWERPADSPRTTRYRNWRIDFAEKDTPFEPEELAVGTSRGIWIAPHNVHAWWRRTQDRVVTASLVRDMKVGGLYELDELWPDDYRLQGQAFEEQARTFVIQAIPFILLHAGLSVTGPVLLYAAVFSLVPVLFPRRGGRGRFTSALTFHLYASIPPLIVGAIYASLGLPSLDFTTVFVCAFMAYLLFVMIRMRRASEA